MCEFSGIVVTGGCPMSQLAYAAGFDAGVQAEADAWDASSQVEKVWFNNGYTICLFSDGKKEKVQYHPEYGYAYDAEKAIMACILKHVVGNSYIKALRAFAGKAPAHECTCPSQTHGCCAECPVGIDVDRDEDLYPAGVAAIDCDEDDSIGYRADDVIECGVVTGMIPGWECMPEEPGYDPAVFED